MRQNNAIIFGVTGQIGSYLLDLLLSKNYRVYGLARRVSSPNTERIKHHLKNPNFTLKSVDITDTHSLLNFFGDYQHDYLGVLEIYNLAAMSFVYDSFSQPRLSMEVTGLGHLNLLEVLKNLYRFNEHGYKVFFMASSEMFGINVDPDGFQRETTPLAPHSPYSVAKAAAFYYSRLYRASYGMSIRSGIIFNSESPRRGEHFVTRKITNYFKQLLHENTKTKLKLGNVESFRDWTHAKDTVQAIYAMMQGPPKDYVISSGQTRSIKDFLQACYNFYKGVYGCCKDLPKLEDLYEIDPTLYRPCEVPYLKGDSSLIRKELGWEPRISFDELVEDMMASDLTIME